MHWNMDVDYYAFGNGQLLAPIPHERVALLLELAAQRNVKLLNLSFGLGDITNAHQRSVIRAALVH